MELKDRSFLLVDIETTGFDEKKHQILEIGMLVIKDMNVTADINIAIKHKEYTITTSAMNANKINIIEHEKNALILEDAAITLLDFLKEHKETDEAYIPIGQNVDFDLRFLEAMFLKLGKIKEYRENISYRKLDIMQVALMKNLEGKLSLEKQDLDYLLTTLDIEIPKDRHRALADCYLEFEVLKRLLIS
jgi:DNA polymerase III epsilon subunit-like protein